MQNESLNQPSQEPQIILLDAQKGPYLLRSLLSKPQESSDPLINSFYDMLGDALAENASDIHIHVRPSAVEIWFRVCRQGEYIIVPCGESSRAFTRLFADDVRSVDVNGEEIDISSMARITVNNSDLRVRVAFLSITADGYACAMRLLPINASHDLKVTDLESLGYSKDQITLIEAALGRSVGGIIAVAGCCGSGLSTATNSMLLKKTELVTDELKIIAIENPYESGFTQSFAPKIDEALGENNESPLEMAARSRPDVLLLGDCRVKVSMPLVAKLIRSGTQVITSVFASSSAIALIPRFASLGMDSDVLYSSDSISCLIYQRLIPKLCEHCRVPGDDTNIDDGMRSRIDAVTQKNHLNTIFVRGKGCDKCRDGVSGQALVAEVVAPNATMLSMLKEERLVDAHNYWLATGGKPIIDDAIEKMLAGVVSPHDVEASFGHLCSSN